MVNPFTEKINKMGVA